MRVREGQRTCAGIKVDGYCDCDGDISGGCRPGPRELIGCKMAQATNYHFDGQAQGCRGGNEAEARTRHVTIRGRPQTGCLTVQSVPRCGNEAEARTRYVAKRLWLVDTVF